jgi:hypothetical protein
MTAGSGDFVQVVDHYVFDPRRSLRPSPKT